MRTSDLDDWQAKTTTRWRIDKKATGAYVSATFLCLVILVWVMQLWRADLTVPFSYLGGDEIFYQMLIKGLLDNGWFLRNHFVGMPTGLDLHDFPIPDNLHLVLMKLMSYWTSNHVVVLNLYFLLTFPLTVLTSLFTFRRFNVSTPPAIVGSLLFTFLPYHFWRGEVHFFLAAYYVVPLVVMVVLWICSKNPIFKYGPENRRPTTLWYGSKAATSIVICILVASGGAYYAFFAGFFIFLAGIFSCIRQRSLQALLTSVILLAVLFFIFVINVLPNIMYAYHHGKSNVHQRSPLEAEMFGTKIAQLLLPVSGHRVSYLANLKAAYNRTTPLVNENDSSSLGIIAGLGFLILLGWLVCGKSDGRHADLFGNLSVLNIAAILLSTIGGFASLFALFISPQIRAYNRMSVYIAFFSLFAVVLFLDNLRHKWSRFKLGRWGFYGLLGLILLIGILDQATPNFVPPYVQVRGEYIGDAHFVQEIEAAVPENAMIFQLPYVSFPEGSMVHRLWTYDLFRGYLHSKTLRWSFGAIRGREGDVWQKQMAAKPVDELVEALGVANFGGIYIDRYGYPCDQSMDLEAKLSKLLDTKPIVSANQRLAFFTLARPSGHGGITTLVKDGDYAKAALKPQARAGPGEPWSLLPIGGKPCSSPAAVIYQGELHLLMQGADDSIYHAGAVSGGWAAWTYLGGLTLSAPTATEFDGELWVAVQGRTKGVYTNRRSGQIWRGWSDVPGGMQTPSGPASVAAADGLYLVVRGMNDRIYVNRFVEASWQGWSEVPGGMQTPSEPAAVVFQGRLQLVVRGTDDAIYANQLTQNGWRGWHEVPGEGRTPSGPRGAATSSTLFLVVLGQDYQIWLSQGSAGPGPRSINR